MPVISRIAANAARAFGMFAVSVAKDLYFKYVTLLLPGNGTNGAQNNTFLDSSTNNFTITRNGNTTQGTFAPYGANWSNYFDGTGDYLTVPNNAVLNLGSSDFTIEAWCYRGTSSTQYILGKGTTGSGNAEYYLAFTAADVVNFAYSASGSIFTTISSSPYALVLNAWNHVAVTRSGSTYYVFLNGALAATGSITATLNAGAATLNIGASGTPGSYWNGYISNVRIVKGSAVYTAAFTPPIAPLTAVSGTSLLTCQSNRFIDNSSNNFTITKNGDTSVQVFSPFSPTAAYSASTIGGSGYFDGSGDYLSVANNTAFAFGTGDFTVEFWVWANSSSASHGLIASDKDNATGTFWACPIISNTIYWQSVNGATNLLSTSYVNYYNQWTHVAVVRNGGTGKLYLNGVEKASAAYSTNYTSTIGNIDVGRDLDNAVYLTGYISDVRVVKGTAVYTAAFTPPTAPLTAITNTSLLLSTTNAGVIDNAMMNDLETVGNAQISTTQSKWGGSSMYFDGTSTNRVKPPASVLFAFGTGDFTVEAWIYITNLTTENFVFDTRSSASTSGMGFSIEPTTGKLRYSTSLNNVLTTTAVSANTWTHVAWVRSGGSTLTGYINGTSGGSAANSNNLTQTNGEIGNVPFSAVSTNMYIDDLRITKGYARYTSNFTAPTGPFPLQ